MENFDWVTARSACSAEIIFEELKKQIQKDVQIRQSLRHELSHYGFRFLSAGTNSFSVIVEGNKINCMVDFAVRDGLIHVQGTGYKNAPNFDMTLTLNDKGECRAEVNGEDHEFWMVRKMALETLFWGSY